MKVAYISGHLFSDVDLSFLPSLSQYAEVDYYVPIMHGCLSGAAFNLAKQYPHSGIYKASDIYPELIAFASLISPCGFYIINSTCKRYWFPKNIWLFLSLINRLRQYDIIHLTDFPYYYMYLIFLLRKKIVLTVHDPLPHSTAACNSLMVRINRWLGLHLFSNFIILNHQQRESFIHTYHLENKHIFESRLSRYDYLHIYKKNIVPDSNQILFFGQIASNKGLDTLLPAMQHLHQECPQAKLIIAGKGTFHFDITPYTNKEYITFINRFIPDNELVELIEQSSFVVCPYTDATQSGVIMTAFAFNKPVIATKVGGFPEQLEYGKYGVLIEPNNIDSLLHTIKIWITTPTEVDEYAQQIARDYAGSTKSWNHIAQEIYNIYQQILHV